MKLIRNHKGAYINVEKIESYSILETIANCNLDVVYDLVAYRTDGEYYVIARFETESRAKECLTELVRWLASEVNHCNVFVREGDAK